MGSAREATWRLHGFFEKGHFLFRGVKGERMMTFIRPLMMTDKIKYRLADFNFLFHLIKHALLVKIEPQNCLLWIVKHVFVSVS